jgi:membrane protein DedA with SNARE-associated domain
VKAMARFGIILVALFAVTGWILTKSYQTAPERRAILVSAILAAVIQIVGYAVLVRSRKRKNVRTAAFRGTHELRRFSFRIDAA